MPQKKFVLGTHNHSPNDEGDCDAVNGGCDDDQDNEDGGDLHAICSDI